eukprot:3731563-Alexandrium_andersonii.AAC.1
MTTRWASFFFFGVNVGHAQCQLKSPGECLRFRSRRCRRRSRSARWFSRTRTLADGTARAPSHACSLCSMAPALLCRLWAL